MQSGSTEPEKTAWDTCCGQSRMHAHMTQAVQHPLYNTTYPITGAEACCPFLGMGDASTAMCTAKADLLRKQGTVKSTGWLFD